MGIMLRQHFLLLGLSLYTLVACGTAKVQGPSTAPITTAGVPEIDSVSASAATVPVEMDSVVPAQKVRAHIYLLLPLQLDEHFADDTTSNASVSVLNSAMQALHFYEGALLAADSLRATGHTIQLSVVDFNTDSAAVVRKLNSLVLRDADAVVSLLPAGYNTVVGLASNRWKMPVYIFAASNTQLPERFPWIRCFIPSNQTQLRQMAAYMAEQFPASHFIAVYRDQRKENELAALFANVTDSVIGKPSSMQLFNFKNGGIAGLKNKLVKGKRNLLVIPTGDESFLSTVINGLQEVKNDYIVRLCGMPSWETFESLDPEWMQSFETIIFNGSFIDTNAPLVQSFRKEFMDEYHTEALPSAFWAWDVLQEIVRQKSGEPEEVNSLVQSGKKIRLRPVCDGCGSENKSVNFLKYGNYELLPLH